MYKKVVFGKTEKVLFGKTENILAKLLWIMKAFYKIRKTQQTRSSVGIVWWEKCRSSAQIVFLHCIHHSNSFSGFTLQITGDLQAIQFFLFFSRKNKRYACRFQPLYIECCLREICKYLIFNIFTIFRSAQPCGY